MSALPRKTNPLFALHPANVTDRVRFATVGKQSGFVARPMVRDLRTYSLPRRVFLITDLFRSFVPILIRLRATIDGLESHHLSTAVTDRSVFSLFSSFFTSYQPYTYRCTLDPVPSRSDRAVLILRDPVTLRSFRDRKPFAARRASWYIVLLRPPNSKLIRKKETEKKVKEEK